MTRFALTVLLVLVVATASGCGGNATRATKSAAAPHRTLTDLHDIGQLRSAFAKASGRPRLIVLMSPT